ncbi:MULTISPECIES: mechanosensitive ion channel family protein [unclassified Leisingera]|uniref:mechanosensitive ion channel family protein n=1 Tax=unclassified Leisingera TaxID=2614906 RepID=UPI0002FC7030|nr:MULTISPECIES: mechanosensitive ion channel family protein [unclassified Leisingera]KIC24689.1 mechanosensitive ion channel protein MscS [Leisingera sp. ANG-S3]KIC55455.1 mechanosensitive ion channel protein MscS [Leisingera sp. ANG-S]KID09187.1 mechanosensitive ion channel protein MscS [Leisingera sp. ANG1]
MLHALFRFLLCLLLGFGLTAHTSAQESDASGAEALSQAIEQAAENGVSVLVVDSSGRLLNAPPEAGPQTGETSTDVMEQPSALMKAQSRVAAFRAELNSRLEALPYSVFEMQYILRQTSPDGRIMTYVEVLGWSVLFLLVGRWLSVEIYGKRFAKRFVVARIQATPEGYQDKMPFLVFRFLMGIGATIFAMIFAALISHLVFGSSGDPSIEFTVTAIYTAYFLARTVSDLWRMVLSPFLAQYRIPVFSDRDAKRLYIWASLLATYDISSTLFATWVGDFGLNYNVYALVYGVLALVGTLGNLLMVLVNGRAISNAIRAGRMPEDCSWLVRFLAVAWAPGLMIYMVFGWLKLAFDLVLEHEVSIPLMAGSYFVLTTILVVYGAINYLIERYFRRAYQTHAMSEALETAEQPEPAVLETGPAAPANVIATAEDGSPEQSDPLGAEGAERVAAMPDAAPDESGGFDNEDEISEQVVHPIATYEDLARRVAGILAFVVGAYSLLIVWSPDASWLSTTAAERMVDVTVILFIGYIVYHLFRIWIDSKIDEEVGDIPVAELGDEGGAGGASRLATLLPLFRGAILAVVLVSIVLILLLELGINVSPLFAGAGVVGLAVGFGSQTLVRDIFSGAFFLIDDAFRKGEYIDIGDVKGTVEKISVRSFQLRHHLGALHTIPFGEIKVLTNYSRDWVMMKLPLRVTYDTDVEKVRKLIKKLGQTLMDDPVVGHTFIQPLKSQGVIEMQDSAMIIRVKFMTKPGDQWIVRKRVYQEIRELFAREGVKFAHREVTVRLAPDQAEGATPKQKDAALGAVQAAIDEDMLEDMGGPDGDDR